VDPAVYLDDVSEDEVEGVLERRVFAVPHLGATVDGERFDRLDPADPDARGILIRGEHPEFHEIPAEPFFDGELHGTNPRLHLTMHEVIANQLWDDNPPEAWQAAQRLRDQGMARHDVLHELLAVMAEHMYPVLAKKQPFDDEAYQRALDELGR
jgi:hypothetical protein